MRPGGATVTKRGTRAFFVVSTLLSALIFVALTIDSHRKFPGLTNAAAIDASVIAGKNVWHRNNCINCHTLLGEGAYYAPDLTQIATQRGAAYLREFLKDPSRFYSEARDRRLMPTLALSDADITALIAFLGWVSKIDTQGWPPRPILVKGSAVPGANVGAPAASAASSDPIELGRVAFSSTPPGCSACHSIAPGVNIVGPTLAGIAATAAGRVREAAYHGQAKDAAGYIRESILDPNAHVLTGPTFSAGGRSLMPSDYGQTLKPEQVDQIVAYLLTLK
jgi:nitric oxide reductase subunit C